MAAILVDLDNFRRLSSFHLGLRIPCTLLLDANLPASPSGGLLGTVLPHHFTASGVEDAKQKLKLEM